jgi:hypothetical protein
MQQAHAATISRSESFSRTEQTGTLQHIYDLNVYATNIEAPIYNIPLQRSIAPITDCTTWWFAAAPFFKSKSTKSVNGYTIENVESGAMFNIGVYSALYVHALFSVAGCKTNHQELRSVPCDVFVGLGGQTDSDEWYKITGEVFFASSSERIKKNPLVAEMFSFGTGVQCEADFCVSESYDSKYELSSLARATYFVPKTNGIEDDKTRKSVGHFTYSAGTFLDLFLSFKQYYGSDYQHQIELGYNPTIHVQESSLKVAPVNSQVDFHSSTEKINTLRNTVFGMYAYNWNVEDVVMNATIGATATIVPSATTYGTLFAEYSVGF